MSRDDFGHLDALADDVRDVVMWLSQELANLSLKWQLYLDLFSEAENRAILHDTAHVAFNAIEESLRVDITMTICRLADPPRSCGEDNLSFSRLANHFASDGILKERIDRFRGECSAVIHRRNKLIAHNDLNTKLDPEENILPGIGRPDIDQIFVSAKETLNYIALSRNNTELRFDGPNDFDGKALIYYLKMGLEADRRERGELE